jgi:hypothetical protein
VCGRKEEKEVKKAFADLQQEISLLQLLDKERNFKPRKKNKKLKLVLAKHLYNR